MPSRGTSSKKEKTVVSAECLAEVSNRLFFGILSKRDVAGIRCLLNENTEEFEKYVKENYSSDAHLQTLLDAYLALFQTKFTLNEHIKQNAINCSYGNLDSSVDARDNGKHCEIIRFLLEKDCDPASAFRNADLSCGELEVLIGQTAYFETKFTRERLESLLTLALHATAWTEDEEACKERIQYLVEQDVDVNSVDEFGTSLHALLACRKMAAAFAFIQSKCVQEKFTVNAQCDVKDYSKNMTALMLAVRQADTSFLEQFCEVFKQKLEFEHTDDHGNTAFILACQYAPLETLQCLKKAGANISAINKLGESGLRIMSLYGSDTASLVEKLIRLFDQYDFLVAEVPFPLELILHGLIQNQRYEVAVAFIDQASQNHTLDFGIRNEGGKTILVAAAAHRNFTLVEKIQGILREKFQDIIDEPDNDGRTALHHACRLGCLEIVKLLLDEGANSDKVDKSQYVALLYALTNQDNDLIAALAECGIEEPGRDTASDTDYIMYGANTNKPIFIYSDSGNSTQASEARVVAATLDNLKNTFIFQKLKESIDQRGGKAAQKTIKYLFELLNKFTGISYLEHCVAGKKAVCQYMLERGVILPAKYLTFPDLPFQAFKAIIEKHGASPDTQDENGLTALHVAAMSHDEEECIRKIEYLVALGANLNNVICFGKKSCEETVLHRLILDKKVSVIIAFIQLPRVQAEFDINRQCNVSGEEGSTPLMLAIRCLGDDIVKEIFKAFKNKLDLTLTTHHGDTLAHLAACSSSVETLAYLERQGVDFKVLNAQSGESVLYAAADDESSDNARVQRIAWLSHRIGGLVNHAPKNGKEVVLHSLIDSRNTQAALALLDAAKDSIDINLKNSHGETALILAAKHSEGAVAKAILENFKISVNINALDEDDHTALHHAITFGHLEIVNRLLDSHANPNARGGPGTLPPLYRAFIGKEASRDAIEKHFGVHPDRDIGLDHDYISHYDGKDIQIEHNGKRQFLIANLTNFQYFKRDLLGAIQELREDREKLREDLQHLSNLERQCKGSTHIQCCGVDRVAIIRTMLEYGAKLHFSVTETLFAMKGAKENIGITFLLGQEIFEKSEEPLYKAITASPGKARNQQIRDLIETGSADINSIYPNTGTVLHHFIAKGDWDDALAFIQFPQAQTFDINCQCSIVLNPRRRLQGLDTAVDDITPLMLALLYQAPFSFLKALCEAFKDKIQWDLEICLINGRRCQAIHLACMHYNLEMIEYLETQGACVKALSTTGMSSLHAVSFMTDHRLRDQIIVGLLQKGVDVNQVNSNLGTVLLRLIYSRSVESVLVLLQAARDTININLSGESASETPLITAIVYAESRVVEAILAFPEAQHAINQGSNKDGNTALHFANSFPNTQIIKMLLDKGANVNQLNRAGQKPLDCFFINSEKKKSEFAAWAINPACDSGSVSSYIKDSDDVIIRIKGNGFKEGDEVREGKVLAKRDNLENPALWAALIGAIGEQSDKEKVSRDEQHLEVLKASFTGISHLDQCEADAGSVLQHMLAHGATLAPSAQLSQAVKKRAVDLIHRQYVEIAPESCSTAKSLSALLQRLHQQDADFTPLLTDDRLPPGILAVLIKDCGVLLTAENGPLTFKAVVSTENQTECSLKAAMLLNQEGIDVNIKNAKGETALIAAVIEGHVEDFKKLLTLFKDKLDINAQDKTGKTALHHASQRIKLEIMEALLMHKADLNIKDKHQKTPLLCLFKPVGKKSGINDTLAVIKLMLNHGALLPHPIAALLKMLGVKEHHSEIKALLNEHLVGEFSKAIDIQDEVERDQAITHLIEQGLDVASRHPAKGVCLHALVARGYLSRLKKLRQFSLQGVDLETVDDDGNTAFNLACRFSSLKVMKFLKPADADLTVCNQQDQSALFLAACFEQDQKTRFGKIQWLLQQKTITADHISDTLHLMLSGDEKKPEAVLELLQIESLGYIAANIQGKESLLCRAVSCRSDALVLKILELFKSREGNLKAQGQDALNVAVRDNNVHIVRALIEHGATVAPQDLFEFYAYADATYLDANTDAFRECVEILIKAGASVLSTTGQRLSEMAFVAAHSGTEQWLAQQEQAALRLLTDALHDTILIEDASQRDQAIQSLIEKGADINDIHPQRGTLLHALIIKGYLESAQAFMVHPKVQQVFDINCRCDLSTQGSVTPLILALFCSTALSFIQKMFEAFSGKIQLEVTEDGWFGDKAFCFAAACSVLEVIQYLKTQATHPNTCNNQHAPVLSAIANIEATDLRRQKLGWIFQQKNIIDHDETIYSVLKELLGTQEQSKVLDLLRAGGPCIKRAAVSAILSMECWGDDFREEVSRRLNWSFFKEDVNVERGFEKVKPHPAESPAAFFHVRPVLNTRVKRSRSMEDLKFLREEKQVAQFLGYIE